MIAGIEMFKSKSMLIVLTFGMQIHAKGQGSCSSKITVETDRQTEVIGLPPVLKWSIKVYALKSNISKTNFRTFT